ncbi:MAG TPA: hypothetical protein VJB99_04355 [Patescibacteria group bacterium]|nr:hypothetical protein [Patescibacteria group bacterium]
MGENSGFDPEVSQRMTERTSLTEMEYLEIENRGERLFSIIEQLVRQRPEQSRNKALEGEARQRWVDLRLQALDLMVPPRMKEGEEVYYQGGLWKVENYLPDSRTYIIRSVRALEERIINAPRWEVDWTTENSSHFLRLGDRIFLSTPQFTGEDSVARIVEMEGDRIGIRKEICELQTEFPVVVLSEKQREEQRPYVIVQDYVLGLIKEGAKLERERSL